VKTLLSLTLDNKNAEECGTKCRAVDVQLALKPAPLTHLLIDSSGHSSAKWNYSTVTLLALTYLESIMITHQMWSQDDLCCVNFTFVIL
jgi:hypothetical protein